MNYSVAVIPSYKIMMQVSYNRYDWELSFVHGGIFAEVLGDQEAEIRAKNMW
ncbi:hypothetical protein [Clostridium akagii]|uniref:hypothetical protein n=1 Tax=Clostridium akagii TaxID=91623 RepID=UPI000AACEA47|nr:hypothetical protein [Clostridium akagii]